MTLGDPELIVQMVQSGLGISFVSKWSVFKPIKEGTIRILKLPGKAFTENFILSVCTKSLQQWLQKLSISLLKSTGFLSPFRMATTDSLRLLIIPISLNLIFANKSCCESFRNTFYRSSSLTFYKVSGIASIKLLNSHSCKLIAIRIGICIACTTREDIDGDFPQMERGENCPRQN